ncbi:MAG: 3-isopropylmalate dehydratase small subunit [Parvularculaceae bacterium]|nr:3-isopropylmalate dehydratase small subunit [Parvularculaceae bacterium]
MSGRAFVFGDNIDTDVLAPGHLMKLAPEELARHCLAAVDPAFARDVRAGDFVVAGRNFGLGSSREQAAVSLKLLGVKAVLAPSFARIFFRNAINLGLPALVFDAAGKVAPGDLLDLDLATGRLDNLARGETHQLTPLPQGLLDVVEAGGLMEMLKRRFAASRPA